MANLIKIDDNDFLVKDYLRQEEINENTLLLNYKTLLKRYLSQGEPSEDTLRSYCSTIDSYIKWCLTNKVHPLKITEYQFMYYRDFLIKMNMKKGSIKVKLNAIKQFYNIAVKLKLIENSPAKDVGVKIHEASEISPMKFLTLEQLRDLLNIIPDYDEKHIEYLRDKIIIMLMALEGLRTVEVHRMSVNDINWEMKTIYIHGKGHNDFIYPRDDVLILLQEYLKIRPFDFTFIDEFGEPVFTTLTNQVKGKRMDRRGIRYNVDKWLTKAGLKKEGISCHMLRHTCGTLLYKDTKDLQIVKQVLRHSNVNITSKYAHIYNKMDKRYTTGINLNENITTEDKKKAHK
ncbi:tyrosine-type recombinase/integrase [Megamonas funiformis]|uniref:tyrosine-type recombinase/integrase n=1 Tax=Megamonas funiformis TaxID=437897 RepID=UPI00399654E7